MALKTTNPTTTAAWLALENHFKDMQNNSIKNMFLNDPERASKFHIQWDQFLVKKKKNNITEETLQLLVELANQVDLSSAIQQYFSGEIINQTEERYCILHLGLQKQKLY